METKKLSHGKPQRPWSCRYDTSIYPSIISPGVLRVPDTVKPQTTRQILDFYYLKNIYNNYLNLIPLDLIEKSIDNIMLVYVILVSLFYFAKLKLKIIDFCQICVTKRQINLQQQKQIFLINYHIRKRI